VDSGPFDGGHIDTDANYADCGSGARTLAVDAGVFVSQFGQGTACTLDAPCATITTALGVAKLGDTIYVGPGTYTETLEIDGTTMASTIEGGWAITDAGWSPQCDDTVAVIQRDPTNPAEWTIHFDNAAAFTLRLVKVVNSAPSGAEAGTSVYGVLSNSTVLTLDNVDIDVGDGVPGGAGDPGMGEMGGACTFIPSDGDGGVTGPPGTPGVLTPTATGWSSVQASSGSSGGPGDNGTPSMGGKACFNCLTTCQCGAGVDGGCAGVSTFTCADAGTCGCGGAGGSGGYGAGECSFTTNGNGGSSVALYQWGSSAAFINVVTLRTGNAGNGGNGGLGADGGSGSEGMDGPALLCRTSAVCMNVGGTCGSACTTGGSYTYSTIDGGAAGGPGGPGGAGGQGGGGAGAFSYGYFAGFSATIAGSPLFQYGLAGQGGMPNGPSGSSGQHN
jgi:hypothetical protein